LAVLRIANDRSDKWHKHLDLVGSRDYESILAWAKFESSHRPQNGAIGCNSLQANKVLGPVLVIFERAPGRHINSEDGSPQVLGFGTAADTFEMNEESTIAEGLRRSNAEVAPRFGQELNPHSKAARIISIRKNGRLPIKTMGFADPSDDDPISR
jgi:hypothetical protein